MTLYFCIINNVTTLIDHHQQHSKYHHGCPRATQACATDDRSATTIKLGSKGEALAVGLLGRTGSPQRRKQEPPTPKGLENHSQKEDKATNTEGLGKPFPKRRQSHQHRRASEPFPTPPTMKKNLGTTQNRYCQA
jgi:hypothetical protein